MKKFARVGHPPPHEREFQHSQSQRRPRQHLHYERGTPIRPHPPHLAPPALNALFLVVCFPLHKLVSLTAPHVTKEEPDAAARVLRFVLSTLALLLLLSMLGTPPIVAWLLAPTEWLPPPLAAAAALFTVVYGFAVCEKGTKLERPWETPIGAYLRGALVEAPADLLAAVGAALTLLLLVRAPPLLHALRRGPGDDAGPLDGAPAGPNVPAGLAPPRSLPATTSWRTVVAYNLAMSAVDLLISVPAALLLGCCVWRAKEAFGRVRAKADGTLLEEGAQRVELFFQLAAAMTVLPSLARREWAPAEADWGIEE